MRSPKRSSAQMRRSGIRGFSQWVYSWYGHDSQDPPCPHDGISGLLDEPFEMIAAPAPISRFTRPPHSGQIFTGLAVML